MPHPFRLAMLAPALAVALSTLAAAPPPAHGRLDALPEGEGVRVHVARRGLFSAFAHDHDFEVTRWHGTASVPDGDPARASVELVLDAASLRDREKGLSAGDRRKVDAQAAGPGVLDAAHAPEIVYRADGASLEPGAAGGAVRGTLHGELTLRGRTRPVDATFEASREGAGWRVRGRARFAQSQFGIRPFSGFGGTVGVKDAVEVTFAIELQPPSAFAAPAGRAPGG